MQYFARRPRYFRARGYRSLEKRQEGVWYTAAWIALWATYQQHPVPAIIAGRVADNTRTNQPSAGVRK